MADINSDMRDIEPEKVNSFHKLTPGEAQSADESMAFAELLFFAYRGFTGEADSVLEEYGFGRAHHRVLHFVCRYPGLRVADLLDILEITKQSLARVLKQLVDDGFVQQVEGRNDRRERRLYLTNAGHELAHKLSDFQRSRIETALRIIGPERGDVVKKFLLHMVTEEERARVVELISSHELPNNWKKDEVLGER